LGHQLDTKLSGFGIKTGGKCKKLPENGLCRESAKRIYSTQTPKRKDWGGDDCKRKMKNLFLRAARLYGGSCLRGGLQPGEGALKV